MDIPQQQTGSVIETFPWKSIVVYTAEAHFFIESYVNWRQLRLLGRQAPPTLAKGDLNAISYGQSSGSARTMFRIWCSHYFTLQVIAITSLDVIPKLWHVSEGVKIPYFCKELEEFWESCVFLIFCWLGYRILNLPNYLYRYYVFKENVVREFYGRKNRNWLFHSMAKGFPTPAVLFLVTMTALEFTIPRKRFNRQYLILVGSFQVAYVILYPILTLPRAKTLSVLEPGRLRYSMEELTKTAGFPLKNIYVVDNIIYDANTGVQAWGWPRKTYITIHKSIVEQHTLDNVVGLLAQELGCWKFGNGPRVFVLGQNFFFLVWTYLMLFLKSHVTYEAFGFKNEYPKVAGIALFALCIAPWFSQVLRLPINYIGRKSCFMADKYAAELGYSCDLSLALTRTATESDLGEVDVFYSLYHNASPQLSERLAVLEKTKKEQDMKEEGLIVSTNADEKA